MMQLKSSGIIQHHMDKVSKSPHMCDVTDEVKPVGFTHMTGELSLLAAGVGLAAVALVGEKLVEYCKAKHSASFSLGN